METVIRQRAGAVDDGYGNMVADWSAPAERPLQVLGAEPVSSTEDNDGRQAVITGYRVYLARDADVLSTDRVVLRGVIYEVDGDPADWRSPWGTQVGGVVVALKAVSG